jgi:hypothetical protein
VADDTVGGIKARRYTSTGCTVGRLGGSTAKQEVIVWYIADTPDPAKGVLLRMQLSVNTVFGSTHSNNTVLTDVQEWVMGSQSPSSFDHCTPSD